MRVDDPSALIGDDRRLRIERQPGERQRAVAHRAHHQARRQSPALAGPLGAQPPGRSHQSIALEAHPGDTAVHTFDLERRNPEAQVNPARRAGRSAVGKRPQDLHVLLRLGIVPQLLLAAGIELELPRVDHQVHPAQVGELLELRGRPLGLHRAAADDEMDVADATRPQARQRVVGDVGRRQILRVPAENPRHVDGDVAGADDRRDGARQVDRQIEKIGVSAVPGDQRRRRVAAGEIFTRDPEPAIALTADSDRDLIVVRPEVAEREIPAHLDVPQEAHPRVERHALEDPDDLLDLRVVRRDTETHEPVRGRQAIENVDSQTGSGGATALRQQRGGGVETGRTGADDGDLDQTILGTIGGTLESRRHRVRGYNDRHPGPGAPGSTTRSTSAAGAACRASG